MTNDKFLTKNRKKIKFLEQKVKKVLKK